MDELIRKQTVLNMINDVKFGNITNKLSQLHEAVRNYPSVDSVEVVRCKDCKYFELNHWDGPIITAHEICSKWGSGCKTDKDGYCFLGERKTDG